MQMTSDIEFISGPLHWNELLREGMRPEDIWDGISDDTETRCLVPPEPWQHAVAVANLDTDQVRLMTASVCNLIETHNPGTFGSCAASLRHATTAGHAHTPVLRMPCTSFALAPAGGQDTAIQDSIPQEDLVPATAKGKPVANLAGVSPHSGHDKPYLGELSLGELGRWVHLPRHSQTH